MNFRVIDNYFQRVSKIASKDLFMKIQISGRNCAKFFQILSENCFYVLDAVRSSRILIGKQKLGVTFKSDKLGGIAFKKISKLTMCSA